MAREDTPGNKQLAAYLVTAAGAGEAQRHRPARLPQGEAAGVHGARPLHLPGGDAAHPQRQGRPPGAPGPRPRGRGPRLRGAAATTRRRSSATSGPSSSGLERVGVNDDFFDLGGDSLLVIRVVTKANKASLGITTKQVFQHRTVAELRHRRRHHRDPRRAGGRHRPAPLDAGAAPVPRPSTTPTPTSTRSACCSSPRTARLQVPLLARALEHVMRHHDHLRVRLVGRRGGGPPGPRPARRAGPPAARRSLRTCPRRSSRR